MSSPRIIFKLSTRSRPDNARRTIDNIISKVKDPNYKIIVTLDVDDISMHGFTYVHDRVILFWGKSNNKIHAFNRTISFIKEWDILVSMSDDMVFYKDGFDLDIREAFNGNYDQFIHFNDGFQGANVCTMSILGRDYYNRDGYVYHPSYTNLWSDVESTEVAKKRGCYKYMGDDNIIFKHHHPAWGLAEEDEQYKKQNSPEQNSKDYCNYIDRKNINFGL